jgi:sugar/nucleoside kinase (ribokinase family)
MTTPLYDVTAIGNAIVDVLAPTTEKFIKSQDKAHGMKKGGMMLIDEARAVSLYGDMEGGVEMPGGSAGNTIAGLASFGGRANYIGKVAQDRLGEVFRNEMQSQKVRFDTTPLIVGASTARCLILVTPDGERTMNTFLGAAVELGPDDIDRDLIASSKVTYLEGYLFDPQQAKQAFIVAAETAHENGHRVSLSLSDPFCVDRHREDFVNLVENHVDILFANEDEIKSLYQVKTFEEALAIVKNKCEIAVLTRSAKGSVIVSKDQVIEVPAVPTTVVDTTGAGDQYAAGFLYGFTQGMDLKTSGHLGALAAAEVISHMGPRPEIAYSTLIEQAKAA